jgi:tetratricopeptide (TPR) repeat protein
MSGYAQLETETGNWSEGQRCTEQALQLNLATGNDYNYYFIFWLKGVLARQVGNYSEAEEHHRFAIMHSQKFNSPVMVAINQMHLAVVCQLMGELQRAEDYSRSAMAITQQIGQRFLQVATAIRLGYILLESGQFTEAEEVLTKVLALQRECGRQDYILETLAGLVEVWLAQQKWEPIKANILELSSGLMREVPTAIGEPFRPYLVGYRALVKLEQRQLASELINFAHFQLLESATKIKEDTLRQAFLNKVAVHAQILAVASRAGSGSDKHLCQI